nr:hypothetical protein F6W77_19510 [Acinetobacter baumannii]
MKVFVAIFLVVALSFGEAINVPSRKARAIVDSFIPEMGRFVRDIAKVHEKRDAEDNVEEAVEDLAALAEEVGEDNLKKRDESSEEELDLDDLLDFDLKRAAQKRKIVLPKKKTEIRAVKPKRRIDFLSKFLPSFDYKRNVNENAHQVVKRSVKNLMKRFML